MTKAGSCSPQSHCPHLLLCQIDVPELQINPTDPHCIDTTVTIDDIRPTLSQTSSTNNSNPPDWRQMLQKICRISIQDYL